MEDYIREWSISPSEIVIKHTKGKEPSVITVTGVMPVKRSWIHDYIDNDFNYWLIADNHFIEIIGDEDRYYSSFHKLQMEKNGRFSYSFRLKNIENIPINKIKKISIAHQIQVTVPYIIEDDDYEDITIFTEYLNVNVLIKEPAETVTQTQPATPTNPSDPAPIDPESPILIDNTQPTTPTQPNTPEKPVQPATPNEPVQPKIAPEAMDTDSILLYAGLLVGALVLIKK